MKTEIKADTIDYGTITGLDYFQIEIEARRLRAEAARAGMLAMTAWIKSKFAILAHAATPHAKA